MRRLFTIPGYLTLALLSVLLAPIWIPVAAVIDLTRKRAALRCGAFLTLYLQAEVAGILTAFAIWCLPISRERYLRWNFRLECWWGSLLLGGAQRIFDFDVEVENGEAASRPPLILMLRHASVADTVLASNLVSAKNDIHLRYVLKRELLWDPCLDIVGNRLPNHFARRDGLDTEREIRSVAALTEGLGSREGILIYPEGTRFTPEKREHVLERLHDRSPEFWERARRLQHLLPPRLGGPLALLESNPGADVVFCAHTGFEATGSFWELWSGALVGVTVRVRFWRVPFGEIPKDHDARIDWLYEHWERIDAWIDAVSKLVRD